jgi:ABC-type branched-subunit amino acid transport system ATPase component/ABC-type branched-subunit amino acid transport system permease subunit
VHDALIVWPVAILAAMVFALAIGALSLRTTGFQFIMVTLAFAQMVYYGGQSLRAYGGDNGFVLPHRNDLAGFSLGNHVVFYYIVLALLVIVVVLAGRMVQSQFGMVIRGGRDNERRRAAIGFPPYRYRLAAFTMAGGIAGLAGALIANHASFVSPALMSWQMSGQLLAMVILGSAGTLIGPIFGAAIYLLFAQVLSDYTDHWMLFFGPLLVARVLFVRDGIWGVIVRATGTGEAAPPPIEWSDDRIAGQSRPVSSPLLEAVGLKKSFGALRATDNVSLDVRPGEVHALIGPNGAGKTTLVGQFTGELAPDAGAIRFTGRDITALPTAQRARLGLARTFQISSVFDRFTAAGNVALSVQARKPHSFRFWSRADRIAALRHPADRLLRALGLAERSEIVAGGLSHGEHRQLELAMALAGEPAMLLLDEPMAGLGVEETQAMTALLERLKGRYAILLIEHDMDVVFSLADRISVLVAGRIVVTGTPEDIRRHPEVRAAYLGEDDEA